MFSLEYAQNLDNIDVQPPLSEEFIFPSVDVNGISRKAIYLCGNSLGLQPYALHQSVSNQLDKWGKEGVEGHFSGDTPWLDIDAIVTESMGKVVGAFPDEVVLMNSLTCNLHLMLSSFYRPTPDRFKILIESKAFPSDYHAVMSQIQLQGYDIRDAIIELKPRESEVILRNEDILETIDREGSHIAVVLLSGIQYYTGQFFDLASISSAAREKGCVMGLDLAHAVGNVPLALHDWGVDFACWCMYKYMNCGPGAIGGCFVHRRHGDYNSMMGESDGGGGGGGFTADVVNQPQSQLLLSSPRPRLAGWWGHRREDRFLMASQFIPCKGADGFRLSNPPVLLIACARASLDLFDKVGMESLRSKSVRLTAYLEQLLLAELPDMVTIFTPSDPNQRGCQLSLTVRLSSPTKADGQGIEGGDGDGGVELDRVITQLKEIGGVICDARKPNVIRVAPAPLYNSFEDICLFVLALKSILTS